MVVSTGLAHEIVTAVDCNVVVYRIYRVAVRTNKKVVRFCHAVVVIIVISSILMIPLIISDRLATNSTNFIHL